MPSKQIEALKKIFRHLSIVYDPSCHGIVIDIECDDCPLKHSRYRCGEYLAVERARKLLLKYLKRHPV